MNVEYMKIKDYVYVTEDNGLTHTRRNVEDIEKILVYENRYEKLGKMLNESKRSLTLMNLLKDSLINFSKNALLLAVIGGIVSCFPLNGIIWLKSLVIPASFLCFGGFVFGVCQRKGISKDINGLENEIFAIENNRIQIRDELVRLKRKSSYVVSKQISDKNMSKEKEFSLKEKPFFVSVDDDKDYLENLYDDLNEAYDIGFNSNSKVKVLKK